MLNCLLTLEGVVQKFGHKIVEYQLQLHAHNGSGFDTWKNLFNLTCERNICNIIKSGKGIFSMKSFNGFVFNDKKKSLPLFVWFRCGMNHVNYILKNLGTTFKLQEEFWKKEKKHEDVYANTWRNKKNEWLDYVKNDVFCTASFIY